MALFDVSELDYIKSGVKKPQREVSEPSETVDFSKVVHFDRTLTVEGDYSDFTAEKYPYGVVFYDFEVFKYDWLVVLFEPVERKLTVICNDRNAIRGYFNVHEHSLWVGYNNKHFDDVIMKALIMGLNPYAVMKKIMADMRERDIDERLSSIKMVSYDLFSLFLNKPSLKTLEGFMGDDIEETSVPFDLPRPLTEDEANLTVKYCRHDVLETVEVFRRRIEDFNSHVNLIETFDLPRECMARTKGQMTARIVNCKKAPHDDEFDIRLVPVIKLDKYSYVKDWFENVAKAGAYDAVLEGERFAHILKRGKQKKDDKDKRTTFITTVAGIPHTFGWGGVHGAPVEPLKKNGRIFHCDVTSFYPSMMIEYGFLTRNSQTPEKFKEVYDTRVALKKAGKKKEQAPYKIILNAQFGITKDKHSEAFDPVQANNICVNGQLLLLDLIEKLEAMGEHMQLLQSNTDGIFVWIDNEPKSERWMRHICEEWIQRTKMGLGFDEVGGVDLDGYPLQRIGMVQKDVNNYVCLFAPKPDFAEKKKSLYDEMLSSVECEKREGSLFRKGGWDDLLEGLKGRASENGGFLEVEGGRLTFRPKLNPELKGKFLKELSDLEYDLPIVNFATTNFIVNGVPVEKSIGDCDSLRDFQMIVRLSGKYSHAVYNGTKMDEKTFRVFASKDRKDGCMYKVKGEDGSLEKVSDCPEHCFIYNGDVKGKKAFDKIDRQWYVNLTKRRLEKFGYELIKRSSALF